MGPTVQFVIALMVAATSLAGGSIAWPRVTTQARPKLLQEVHDIVIKTQIGKQTANVLGVTDETTVQPINIGATVTSVVNGAKSSLQNRAQTIIVGNAVNQLRSQFDKMPKDQKDQIQQIFCKAPDTKAQ